MQYVNVTGHATTTQNNYSPFRTISSIAIDKIASLFNKHTATRTIAHCNLHCDWIKKIHVTKIISYLRTTQVCTNCEQSNITNIKNQILVIYQHFLNCLLPAEQDVTTSQTCLNSQDLSQSTSANALNTFFDMLNIVHDQQSSYFFNVLEKISLDLGYGKEIHLEQISEQELTALREEWKNVLDFISQKMCQMPELIHAEKRFQSLNISKVNLQMMVSENILRIVYSVSKHNAQFFQACQTNDVEKMVLLLMDCPNKPWFQYLFVDSVPTFNENNLRLIITTHHKKLQELLAAPSADEPNIVVSLFSPKRELLARLSPNPHITHSTIDEDVLETSTVRRKLDFDENNKTKRVFTSYLGQLSRSISGIWGIGRVWKWFLPKDIL